MIGVTKLRNKYKPFETKLALCNAYDLFLADDRILPMLPRLIGRKFFEKKKQPIAVCLSKSKEGLAIELTKALNSTVLHLGAGACVSLRFASTSHSSRQIEENLISAVENAVEHIPKKWANIQSIHIKSSTSISLPIFNSIASLSDEVEEKSDVSDTILAKVDEKIDNNSANVSDIIKAEIPTKKAPANKLKTTKTVAEKISENNLLVAKVAGKSVSTEQKVPKKKAPVAKSTIKTPTVKAPAATKIVQMKTPGMKIPVSAFVTKKPTIKKQTQAKASNLTAITRIPMKASLKKKNTKK